MKLFIFICLIAYALSSKAINKNFIEHLKKVAPFEVYDIEENPFRDYTDEELKARLGALEDDSRIIEDSPISKLKKNENYDFRKEYPDCVKPTRDQGNCGSCWAFGSVTALRQRFCITTQGKQNFLLSPEDPICCDWEDMGCQGGYLKNAWYYLYDEGVVDEECFPYTSMQGKVESCNYKCRNGAPWKKYFANRASAFNSIEGIKGDLTKNGPVNCQMDIYQDFYDYKGGIYEHVIGTKTGGHSIIVIGYGSEDNTDYWIVQNSWGDNWGESGYFRIKMGQCGIEKGCYAATPVIKNN